MRSRLDTLETIDQRQSLAISVDQIGLQDLLQVSKAEAIGRLCNRIGQRLLVHDPCVRLELFSPVFSVCKTLRL